MSTSDRPVVLEAAVAAALVLACCVLFSRADLFITGFGFHPVWIAVLVLAARYGTSGLLVSLAMTWGVLIVATVAVGRPLSGLALRLGAGADACALAASILVAWIANLHAGRSARVAARMCEIERRLLEADDIIAAMHEGVAFLRARHDRIEVSLSLWRDLSARLEHGDPEEAALAALELCAIRCGAAAGIVQRCEGVSRLPLARFGQWSPSHSRPRDVVADRTAVAAVSARRPISAHEVESVTADDSDVAVPILDEMGVVLGVICLRGLAPAQLSAADLSDLTLSASWLAPALQRKSSMRRARKDAF